MRSPAKPTGIVSPTITRVPLHTPDHLNQRILRRGRENIAACAAEPAIIEQRLFELDREWDIERVLEANASSLTVLGTLLGYLVTPWLYWIPLLVGSFLLQHAIQGWCPPIRLFRRLGFRTQGEIATEYYALRALRGDFSEVAELEGKNPAEKASLVFGLMAWPYRAPDRNDQQSPGEL